MKVVQAPRRRRAFTLVELLVVIGIIAIMISILMPALSKARDKANAVKCASNMRQIFLACQMFAQDNKDALPRCSFASDVYNPATPDKAVEQYSHWAMKGDGIADLEYGGLWRYIQGRDTRAQVVYCPGDNNESVRYGTVRAGSGFNRNMSYSFNAATMNPNDVAQVNGWLSVWAKPPVRAGTQKLPGIRLGSVKDAAGKIFIFEEIGPNDTLCLDPVNNEDDTPSGRHSGQRYINALRISNRNTAEYRAWKKAGRGNHCFFDGHVEMLAPGDILDKTTFPNLWWPLW